VRIAFMADHPEVLPRLRALFEAEWPAWYGPAGPGDAAADLRAFCRRDALPIGLVALYGDEPLGVMALKATSIDSRPDLGPWAAAGLVRPELRRRGVGAALLRGLEDLARALAYPRLYAGTATAATLLERAGWQYLDHADAHGERVAIYEKVLRGDRDLP